MQSSVTCWQYAVMTRNKSLISRVLARVYDISYSMYARMKEDDFRLCRQAVQRTRLDKWHVAIIEEIKLDTFNTIHIGQSVDGTYAVSIDWCTGTAGGGSHPSVWDEPVRDYKEAVRQGILLLERQYNKAERWSVSDRSNYNPKVIRSLKGKLLEIKRKYTQPRQLSLF